MWATDSDVPEIEEFLQRHVVQSMFPLANLKNFGLNGDNPRALNFWLSRREGRITDALCLTQEGMLMPQCPSMDWSDLIDVFRGRDLIGIIGPKDQVRSLQNALGLASVPTTLDQDEPQYELDLNDLIVPDGAGGIVPLADADPDEMIAWRTAYDIEALKTPASEAGEIAARDYAHYVAHKTHVVLMDDDQALCTTGFNARLKDIVQIGGVYTPPHLRGKGHARRAVALHLHQVKAQGVKRATLFSANEGASRAYKAIGFTYIGQWTLCLFDGKQRIHD